MLALHTGLGQPGVFIAIAVTESMLAVVSALAFRQGRWKNQKV